MKQIKNVADVLVSTVDKKSYTDQLPVRLINYTDVYYGETLTPADARMKATATRDQLSSFRLRAGDSILTKDSETADDIGVSAYPAEAAGDVVCGYHLAILRPRVGAFPKFLYWCLKSEITRGQFSNSANGMTRYGLTTGAIKSTTVPNPVLKEQRRIADFLDDQVARIDNIIAARRAQVLGSAEVVDVMWSKQCEQVQGSRVPLRRVTQSIADGPFGSSLKSSHYVDAGTRVIRLGNIGINRFKDGDRAFIASDYAATLKQHDVRAGDVLMAGLGDPTWPLGRSAVAPDDLGPTIVKADCYRIRLTGAMRPEFAAWYLSSPPARDQFALLSRGATRARLNTNLALDVEVLVPPIEVQDRVLADFDSRNEAETSAQSALNAGIDLMQEMKRSLITAAVTGEFDVSTADGSRVLV